MAESSGTHHCDMCFETKANYVCPRCNAYYCSVACYKNPEKHLKCSEAFYRQCVEEELTAGHKPSEENDMSKSMKEILKRVHEQSDDPNIQKLLEQPSDSDESDEDEEADSDDEDSLQQRLQGIDLDDPESVWKILTAEEREGFRKKLEKAKLDGVEVVADPWSPLNDSQPKLVEELKIPTRTDKPSTS